MSSDETAGHSFSLHRSGPMVPHGAENDEKTCRQCLQHADRTSCWPYWQFWLTLWIFGTDQFRSAFNRVNSCPLVPIFGEIWKQDSTWWFFSLLVIYPIVNIDLLACVDQGAIGLATLDNCSLHIWQPCVLADHWAMRNCCIIVWYIYLQTTGSAKPAVREADHETVI